ncbi:MULTISPECIES: FAD/NAD(P)-binding oxidoreductase [unclassified Chelatococcus]|uniref:NAD(P)/FAD-dependent oxidoreductase n=1 Tax=unclassified Chelatococcus TaxID=2638111 RepID=UPI001BCBFA53|nr:MULTISPECIES: FAD/NAD(P)-binding oxidoreductase [unclassified Chelatococcus]MBS7700844.1 FAD-dependent oxidoreductase [Chelatococcus sp. YT9]MBX3555377.1 FAD-dependent oxidoreductase [Chelatococcus sp.]
MSQSFDAIVIGAGPAGMASAATLAEGGARTLVVDEQPELGGQIYRAIERNRADPALGRILGPDYLKGGELVDRLRASPAELALGTLAWRIDDDLTVWTRTAGAVTAARAGAIIIATGAMERPVPTAGWTLPGVMTIGALQILLKSAQLTPSGRLVLAGSGPLFYLFARQCVAAGVKGLTLLDTAPTRQMWGALPLLPGALGGEGWRYLTKGVKLLAALRLARVPIYRNVRDIAIEGRDRAEAIRFTAGGRTHRLPCDTVGLHEGVVPHQQMTRSIGIDHDFDEAQRCFRPRHDASGRTAKPGIFVAGDAGGIIGAEASAEDGTIAALAALHDLGRLTAGERDRRVAGAERARRAHLTARSFLDRLYQPRAAILDPPDAVTVCRCEVITAAALRDVARKGVVGPNQAKAFLRCGMGPCQGRLCGPTVTEVIAHATGLDAAKTGYYRIRSPLKPITVGELATAAGTTELTR